MVERTICHASGKMQASDEYVCPLCGGQHGNNSQCQAYWPDEMKAQNTKGNCAMDYSREAREMSDLIVRSYAERCRVTGLYILNITDLPQHELGQFAVLVMGSIRGSDSEATGPDNPLFDGLMMPSLIRLLRSPSDVERQKDFADEWTHSVIRYFQDDMEKLVDRSLEDLNDESDSHDEDEYRCNGFARVSNSDVREDESWRLDPRL